MLQIFATKFCGKNTHFFETNNVSFNIMAIFFLQKMLQGMQQKMLLTPVAF